MSTIVSSPQSSRPALRLWLHAVAALVFVTLIVGGATRLTESGLSIVEWKPLTGVLPPLDAAAWQVEFDKYKAISQYRERNSAMTLAEFKTIYWWEWTHRMLARLVGGAFLLPFLWFLWRGAIEPQLRARLWTIFAFGTALGAIGWWMVASGLADRVSVSQYRLAFHLTLACAIFAALLWTAADLAPRPPIAVPGRIRAGASALVILVLVQIYLGALVAGLRAGLIYNTWPLIDGGLVPDSSRLFFEAPFWRNFFENALTAQFDHRTAGYLLWLLALLHAADVARVRRGGPALTGALLLASAVTLQAALGVVTLLHQAPLALALGHQGLAIVVLAVAVAHAQRFDRRAARAWVVEPSAVPVAGKDRAT
jgi:cytochrome c oxidase assembly protein subunit 15